MIRFLLLILPASLCAVASSDKADHLIFGWYDWRPYQYVSDANDGLTGLDVELLRVIFRRAGYELQFKPTPWKQQLQKLREGGQHITVGFRTPERETYLRFSETYRKETNVLYVLSGKGDLFGFNDLDGLLDAVKQGDFRLGVVEDYAYGPERLRHFLFDGVAQGALVKVEDDYRNFHLLLNGEIDGFLADRTVAATIAHDQGWQNLVAEHPAYFNREDIYVMFSKAATSEADVAAFNKALASLRAEGGYHKRVQDYLFPILLSITVSRRWFFAIDILGTIAFAISGLVLARKERFSLLGAFVLAALPAVGGGVIRDLLVNRHPIGVMRSPAYLIVILVTVIAGFVCFKLYDHWRNRHQHKEHYQRLVADVFTRMVEVFDALGLAAFTVTGVVIAVEAKLQPLWLWGPLLACLTGAGGGIVRDVVRADVRNPNLKGVFYPEVAVIWGLLLALFLEWQHHRLNHTEVFFAVIVTISGAFITRIAAVLLKLRGPMFAAPKSSGADGSGSDLK